MNRLPKDFRSDRKKKCFFCGEQKPVKVWLTLHFFTFLQDKSVRKVFSICSACGESTRKQLGIFSEQTLLETKLERSKRERAERRRAREQEERRRQLEREEDV